MSNENDPWGQSSKDKPSQKPDNNQFGGPPDLDELLQGFLKKFSRKRNTTNGSGSEPSGSNGVPVARLLIVGLVLLALLWAAAGFYVIQERERGVVLRLGRYQTTLAPGLQWQPYYIDKVIKVNLTAVRDRFFDNEMLTRDENIVEVRLQVQYVVDDPRKFILEVRDPENTLSLATDSALRHIVGSTNLDDILTTGRQDVADKVKVKTQSFLDAYQSGLNVSKVNVSVAKPPDEVKPAFDDVIKAREDKVRSVNEATAYENSVVPIARGQAERVLYDAEGHKENAIAHARGDTQRFLQLLKEYKKAPEVTKKRLYIDAMQSIFSNTSKIVVDVDGGNSLMYLPIDQILQKTSAGGNAASRLTQQNNTGSSNLLGPDTLTETKGRLGQQREGR